MVKITFFGFKLILFKLILIKSYDPIFPNIDFFFNYIKLFMFYIRCISQLVAKTLTTVWFPDAVIVQPTVDKRRTSKQSTNQHLAMREKPYFYSTHPFRLCFVYIFIYASHFRYYNMFYSLYIILAIWNAFLAQSLEKLFIKKIKKSRQRGVLVLWCTSKTWY